MNREALSRILPRRPALPALILLFLLALQACPAAAAAENGDGIRSGYNVLVIHSYHEGFAWSDSISSGLRDGFAAAPQPVDLSFAYMDSAGISPEGYFPVLYNLYRVEYAGKRFDLVIAADDNAFRFLSRYHADLFPEVPVVFCGVNDPDSAILDGWDECTGVVEEVSLRETIDAALALQPGVAHLLVVNDGSPDGIANKKRLDAILPVFEGTIDIAYLADPSPAGVQSALAGLSDDTIVLVMTFWRDAGGQYYPWDASIGAIAAASRVPVYSVWEHYLDLGITGGKCIGGYDQGTAAADLAIRILRGEKASSIAFVRDIKSRFVFDHAALQRFGISESALPVGSEVINRPPAIIPVDIRVYWGTIAGIAILVLAIALLGLSLRRQQRVERELRVNREKLRALAMEQHRALEKIEENLEQMAILNDHIRNPLTVIVGLADLQGGEIRDPILRQAEEIDRIVNRLDVGWLESEKIREFLRKHYPTQQ